MSAHDEHGNRDFWNVPRPPSASAVWDAQRQLESAAWRRSAEALSREDAETLFSWVKGAHGALDGRVFRIPPRRFEELQRRIAALDRRAGRLGGGPIQLWDSGERDSSGYVFAVLRGRAPVLAGWALAAVIELRDGRRVVRAVSELGERLMSAAVNDARCDHCHLRRLRKKTFVVVHVSSGEVRQVGSSCLRDFLGGRDPERACRRSEQLAELRAELRDFKASTQAADAPPPVPGLEEFAAHAAPPPVPGLEEFAAHAARVVRSHGWRPRRLAADGKPTTATLALESLEKHPGAPSDTDRALADAALRWARMLLPLKSAPSEFERDALAAVSAKQALGVQERGLVCALIGVYRQRRARSQHLSTPGSRINRTVVVERVLVRKSARHGTVNRCEFVDVDGNRLVWWQTSGPVLRLGERITVNGRVERHTTFGVTAVTVLSHCRIGDRSSSSPNGALGPRAGTS